MGNLLILVFLGLLIGAAAAIVIVACRIILGWTLPRPAVARIDHAASRLAAAFGKVMGIAGKLMLIGIAAFICWFVYLVITGTP